MTDHAHLDKVLEEYLANSKASRLSIRDILAEAPVELRARLVERLLTNESLLRRLTGIASDSELSALRDELREIPTINFGNSPTDDSIGISIDAANNAY